MDSSVPLARLYCIFVIALHRYGVTGGFFTTATYLSSVIFLYLREERKEGGQVYDNSSFIQRHTIHHPGS